MIMIMWESMFAVCTFLSLFRLSNTSGSVFNWTWRYKYVLYTRIILCTAGISCGWLVNGLLCAISMWSVGHWKDSQILWKFKGCLSDDCVGLAHIEFEALSTWCRKHLKRSCAKSLTCLALIFLTSNDVDKWCWITLKQVKTQGRHPLWTQQGRWQCWMATRCKPLSPGLRQLASRRCV